MLGECLSFHLVLFASCRNLSPHQRNKRGGSDLCSRTSMRSVLLGRRRRWTRRTWATFLSSRGTLRTNFVANNWFLFRPEIGFSFTNKRANSVFLNALMALPRLERRPFTSFRAIFNSEASFARVFLLDLESLWYLRNVLSCAEFISTTIG